MRVARGWHQRFQLKDVLIGSLGFCTFQNTCFVLVNELVFVLIDDVLVLVLAQVLCYVLVKAFVFVCVKQDY